MLTLILSLAIASQGAPGVRDVPPPGRFAGGFIQLTESMANDPASRLSREAWRDVLLNMKELGMTTVILQQLAHGRGDRENNLIRPGDADDAVELILDEADGLGGMTVFLGLWNHEFSERDFGSDAFLDEATARSKRLLETIEKDTRYVQHASFGGWYLPIEPWNFKERDGETKRLARRYLAPLAAACKEVADKPVGFSCYFNPAAHYAEPAEMAAVYGELISESKIDILMLQDGAGEEAREEEECRGYMAACREACRGKAQFWAILECFTNEGGGVRVPRDVALLPSQFAAGRGIVDQFVTFDFFHYMNPGLYQWADGSEMRRLCAGGPAAARKPLYDGYKKLIEER